MNRYLRRTVTAGVVAACWIVAAPVVAKMLIVERNLPRADAVIVLAGSAVLSERAQEAVSVVRQGRSSLVILTNDGGRGPWSRRHQARLPNVDRAREELTDRGVPAQRIVELKGTVHSTFDEALGARAYVREHRLRSLLLVTSAYHSRRALWVFRRVLATENIELGIDAVPPGIQTPSPAIWWLTARGWQTVGGEYPKLAYYFIAHR